MDKEPEISTISDNDISLCSFIDELSPQLNLINCNINQYAIKRTKTLDSFTIVLLKQIKYKIDTEDKINTDSNEMIAYKEKLVMVINDILSSKEPKLKSQLLQFYQQLSNVNYYILSYKTFFEVKVKSDIITTHIVFKFTLQISRRSGVVLLESIGVKLYYEVNKVFYKDSIDLNDYLSKREKLKMTLYNSVIDDLANVKCGCVSQDCYICSEKDKRPFEEFIKELNKIAHYNDTIKEESQLFFANKLYAVDIIKNVLCSFCPFLNHSSISCETENGKVSKLFYAKDTDHPCVLYACQMCYSIMNSDDRMQICPNCFNFSVNFHYIQKTANKK